MDLITVAEYAEQHGISVQAVYSRMKRKTISAKLQGHIRTVDGKKVLDEYAVSVLEDTGKPAKVIVESDNSLLLERLKQEVEKLRNENRELREENKTLLKQVISLQQAIIERDDRFILQTNKTSEKANISVKDRIQGLLPVFNRKKKSH